MDQRRITISDIVMGEPLPWDVYDDSNRLLLRKGQIIARESQISTLITRGMFVEARNAAGGRKQDAAAQRPTEQPSVVRYINLANKRLERLLFNLHAEDGLEAKILDVARVIGYAVQTNADIALSCIMLNQGGCPYSVRHCVDTAIVVNVIGRALQKPQEEVELLMAAALTMNVGMLRQQEQFHQRAGALTGDDKSVVHAHPETGVALLREAGVRSQLWLDCVLHHHENEDGSGYPAGKRTQEIPEGARILALADRYCARVAQRGYRKSMLPNAALRDILTTDKDKIDARLAALFIRELGVYPMGSYVRLENGEIGVVTGRGKTTTTPTIHALIGPRGAPLSFPIKRDTSRDLHAIRDVLAPEQAAVRISMQQIWGMEAAA